MKPLIDKAAFLDLMPIAELDGKVFGEMGYSKVVIRQFMDIFPDLFLVARQGKTIAGYSLGAISQNPAEGWINAVGIDHRYRRCGIGKALTESLIYALFNKGVSNIYLTVHPLNLVAFTLYTKIGFKESGLVNDYFGPGEVRRLMSLRS